jgi:hypothetical protein
MMHTFSLYLDVFTAISDLEFGLALKVVKFCIADECQTHSLNRQAYHTKIASIDPHSVNTSSFCSYLRLVIVLLLHSAQLASMRE